MKSNVSILNLCLCGFVVFVAGCSVKEDREFCPCRLLLDFSEVDTSVIKYADVLITGENDYGFMDLLGADKFEQEYVVPVPRGVTEVGVCYCEDGYVLEEGGLRIPYGDDCPRLYMHSSVLDASGEMVCEKVMMHKNYCTMTVCVRENEGFPFLLDVKGSVDGYGPGGEPSVGGFYYVMNADSDGLFQVTVPRQVDNSLLLGVNDGTEVLKVFTLGEYLKSSGYDWSALDLEDVTVSLDYALGRIVIEVEGWDKEYTYDVVI